MEVEESMSKNNKEESQEASLPPEEKDAEGKLEESLDSDKVATPIDIEVSENGNADVVPKDVDSKDLSKEEEDEIIPESDLSNPERRIWIVTTAALPWLTGTGLNPLMRALYLTRGRPKHHVTLLIPWLEDVKARKKLYGEQNAFTEGGKEEQEEWIRDYCRTRCSCEEEEKNLRIMFWNGTYHHAFGSIFPTVDICSLIPNEEADVAILEEPEHLNWFRVPDKNVDNSNVDELGWNHKFKWVVGVLHTNYEAYIRQYGWGTSMLSAPALSSLSSLVVRAYCRRLIRLSATLPSLDSSTEVTSNVHGVRAEFLDPPEPEKQSGEKYAPVYFVGKLIWAKGFDKVLEVQERFKAATGEYFSMDVYGGGNDSKTIKRGFFGRHGEPLDGESESASDADGARAADVFGKQSSLRAQVYDDGDDDDAFEADAQFSDEEGVEVIPQSEAERQKEDQEANEALDILGDLSGKTLNTGTETAGAAYRLVESLMETGLRALNPKSEEVSEESSEATGEETSETKSDQVKPNKRERKTRVGFSFVPAKSRFKWRRTPLPARFLGVKDHVIVRDIPEQKVFLNMSTTEVLCTTSAEALAMGKFVIIPKHPSNEFFFSFPNCLAYKDLDDCVVKLQYALENNPEPVTDKYAHMLSWSGATERLYKASGMSRKDADERKEAGLDEAWEKAARFHVESARKSRFVTSIFSGKMLKKAVSSISNASSPE